ncbi:uncharacterized protein LOC129222300 [Uloborus diversus]|uniref:uncharacterized protein LOC129222300 n=1 Tax=Uloborus diversus TaxID=327109 RepID=UPI002409BC43|nr:uncharacterized protein LOC129222300 [Uloborus diversus]
MSFHTYVISAMMLIVMVLMQDSGCNGYQMMAAYPLNTHSLDRQIFRRGHPKDDEDSASFPKIDSDIFGSSLGQTSDHIRLQDENDFSSSSDESPLSILPSRPIKRRKGPTLSVVNPLEILRQRLMLDLARRRIHENQQQIVANAQLLENIGKRSSGPEDEDQP